jgi:ethanolamine utilization protein EutQ (cupin superfamily)
MKVNIMKDAAGTKLPLLDIPNIKAYLLDIASSDNEGSPITAGLFRLEKGEPLEFTYKYDEVKIVLEGEVTITDDNGVDHELVAGDLINFASGANTVFKTNSSGLMFYVAQKKFGVL